jgi:hypothetical protein
LRARADELGRRIRLVLGLGAAEKATSGVEEYARLGWRARRRLLVRVRTTGAGKDVALRPRRDVRSTAGEDSARTAGVIDGGRSDVVQLHVVEVKRAGELRRQRVARSHEDLA